ERVEYPRFGRVRHAQPQRCATVGTSRNVGVTVTLQVWIIDAGSERPRVPEVEAASDVGHVVPTVFDHPGAQVPPRQPGAEHSLLAPFWHEIPGRVLRFGSVVVVAAEHEQTGIVQ